MQGGGQDSEEDVTSSCDSLLYDNATQNGRPPGRGLVVAGGGRELS